MAGSSAGVQTGGAGDGGEPSSGGAGGGGNPLDCSQLHGKTFGEHCYVDVTTESIHQADADAACVALARTADRAAHLLVLDSREEQAFIVQTFLNEVRDAWLGLTCSSTKHPELTDCYCVDCADTLLLSKRAVWSWLDGSTATFGWSGNNPDGGGRCSALAYNPTISVWGWVDRSCLSTSHQLEGYPLHSYRVICELP